MHNDLEEVCKSLEKLANTLINTGTDRLFSETVGATGMALTPSDLAQVALDFAAEIKETGFVELKGAWLVHVQDIPRRLAMLEANTVPHMFSGSAAQATPAYLLTLLVMREQLLPGLGWQAIPDANSLPANLARRVRLAQAELDRMAPNLEKLDKQISLIQTAHDLADTLPVDLQALAEARVKLSKASLDSEILAEKVKVAQQNADLELAKIVKAYGEAEKLVNNCEDAYKITTTKGLAAAFDERAGGLARTMWIWVGGLIVALIFGSFIGAHRLELLSKALEPDTVNWGRVSVQPLLSLLSVGAPLWFAWLATSHIGQHFKLAEDYAFKASVAKAYEGYRKEAARIDPVFESKLFASALARLDEAPLRLVEGASHGSPWHELANSEAARRAFNVFPELQQKVTGMIQDAIGAASKFAPKREASKSDDTTSDSQSN